MPNESRCAEARLFSVVIPTFNRPEELAHCLRALSRQTLRGSFEVIVVNDGGSSLPFTAAEFESAFCLRILNQPNAGPASARNFGAANAAGSILAFTDDDCEPSERWLEEMECALQSNPGALVGGSTVNRLADNLYSAASQLLIDFLYEFYLADRSPRFFTSNNMALSRQLFAEVGGFDGRFPLAAAEDRDFCANWRSTGRPMVRVPQAVVFHSHKLTFRSYFRQHFQYGRGAYPFHGKTARSTGKKIRMEPVGFYAGMMAYPWRAGGPAARRLLLAALFAISQVANATGYFYERYRPRRWYPE